MQQCIIHNLPVWLVTSHGNGLAYEVVNKPQRLSVFFQGDDASEFRDRVEEMTERAPFLNYSDAIGAIWYDYIDLAENWIRQ